MSPVVDNPGTAPGVIFYAVSADRQDVWLTATELRFPHPIGIGYVRFVRFISADADSRVLHLHAGQMPVSK